MTTDRELLERVVAAWDADRRWNALRAGPALLAAVAACREHLGLAPPIRQAPGWTCPTCRDFNQEWFGRILVCGACHEPRPTEAESK